MTKPLYSHQGLEHPICREELTALPFRSGVERGKFTRGQQLSNRRNGFFSFNVLSLLFLIPCTFLPSFSSFSSHSSVHSPCSLLHRMTGASPFACIMCGRFFSTPSFSLSLIMADFIKEEIFTLSVA